MWGRIIAWLFGTQMGRGVVLAGSVAIGAGISWYVFSEHYEQIGYEKCKAEQQADKDKANIAQQQENEEKEKLGSDIAKKAGEEAADVIKQADNSNTTTKKEIEDVYSKPAVTAPVALGSCSHPVDKRVQERIDRAVEAANR